MSPKYRPALSHILTSVFIRYAFDNNRKDVQSCKAEIFFPYTDLKNRVMTEQSSKLLKIEDAVFADAAEILSLQKLAYLSEARLYHDYSIPPLTQTIEELVADFGRKTFLKAIEDGKIVGSVNGFLQGDRCLIGRLMVHPEQQGMGIGTRLLKAIEVRFEEARSWELFTGELSVKNIRLYERLGYREVRREPLPGKRFAVVIMRKSRANAETYQERTDAEHDL